MITGLMPRRASTRFAILVSFRRNVTKIAQNDKNNKLMQKIASNNSFIDRTGIPPSLIWGYIGIMIFMMGDGMETGWLSPYLSERGMSIEQNAALFTAYGITIAVSAWFSGVL